MSLTNTPPRDKWPRHLWLRGSRFYARLRVPPSTGHRHSHLQESLGTGSYSEAVRRLPVVAGKLRLQIERMRVPTADRSEPERASVDVVAKWWRERLAAAGHDPAEGIPDSLAAEWDQAIEDQLGPVVGEDEHERGLPVHAHEADA